MTGREMWMVRPLRVVTFGEALGRLLRKKRFLGKGKYSGIVRAWERIVGPGLAEHSCVCSFSHGIIVIEVDNPVLLQELSGFMKDKLLNAMQETDEARDAADLRFKLSGGRSSGSGSV